MKKYLHKALAVLGLAVVILPTIQGLIPSGAPKVVTAILGGLVLIATKASEVLAALSKSDDATDQPNN